MPALQVILGKRVREFRLKAGFSQESFADHCGLHRTYMGGVERGERNLTIESVMMIATGLGISMSELLAGIEAQAVPSKRRSKPPAKVRRE